METETLDSSYPTYYKDYETILAYTQDGEQAGAFYDYEVEDLFETTVQ